MGTSAEKTSGSTHLEDHRIHISAEQSSVLINPADDAFVKNNQKPTHLHAKFNHRQASDHHVEIQACHVEQCKKRLRSFHCFLAEGFRKNTSHWIMYLFISTMHLFDHHARDKSKKGENNADVREARLLLKVGGHLSPAESCSLNQGVLRKNNL